MLAENVSQISSIKSQEVKDLKSRGKVRWRVWPAASKLQVLKDIDALKSHQAEIGSYLRRKGLFSSTASWTIL